MVLPRLSSKCLVLALLSTTIYGQIDISAVAEAGPPPTPSIAINVPSQVVRYNHVSVETAAAAEQSAEATSDDSGVQKRAACDPQWLGQGPAPTPDTVEAFQNNQAMKDAANNAPTPPGYKRAYGNMNSTANALGYMGFTLLDHYDVLACANKCNVIDGCAAININFERSPSQDPSPSGGECEQPPSTNLIKCVFWGGPVSVSNAVNDGQWRNNFHVVNAGSNGYTNQTVDDVTGYTLPGFLGSRILNPPNDCHGESSLVGTQYWNDGLPFDTRRCAAACNAQLSADPNHSCYFFNTYVVNKNGQPQGQYCAMYSQQWRDSDGTQSEVFLNGDRYTFSYSYSFANLTNNGLPCGGSPTSTSPAASPSSSAVTCPGSNGTTIISHGNTFLIECFIDHSGGDMGGINVESFQQCIESCATTDGCVDVSLSGSACYMKRTLGDAHENGGVWGAKVVEASVSPTSSAPASTEANPASSTPSQATVEDDSSTSTSSTTTGESQTTPSSASSTTSEPSNTTPVEAESTSSDSSTSTSEGTPTSTSTDSSTTSPPEDTPTSTPTDSPTATPPEDTPTSTPADPTTSSDEPTSTTTDDTCSPTAVPGQVLTAPACDPLWTLQGVTEEGVNQAGSSFSANIACGTLDTASVNVFENGYQLNDLFNTDESGVHFPYGFYSPVTLSFLGKDSNGYPFISSFDLVFGYATLTVSVVDGDSNAISNCELHITGAYYNSPFAVTMHSGDDGSAHFMYLPYTNVDIKAITSDGRFADANDIYSGSGFLTMTVEDFSNAQDANWDFSGSSMDGWSGNGEVYRSEQYPCLQSEGICDYDEPIQFPDPLPWWPWLPWWCDNPDQFFGCYCFDFENFFCGLDFYCQDGELCVPFLPCCFPPLLKRESGGATIPRALLERQAAASASGGSDNGTSDAGQGPQYGAVANMTQFIEKLAANVQLRKNDTNVVDVSRIQKKNVSTILTTLSKDPNISPDANVTDGVAPAANIMRKRDPALALFGRDPDDYDLFVRTNGLMTSTNTATFNVDSSTKSVFIRFKFITSELRRNSFNPNDDDFVVSIKSDKGDIARKTGSVQSIPQYQFDENGATDWMELKLTLSPGVSKVRFDMSVENKYDSDYDSALVIDKAGAVGGCSQCGNCDECSSDPICSDTCQTQQYGSCDFYSDCMEASRPCDGDPSSYALQFGEKQCNRYLNSNMGYQLSGQGHYFANSAMDCVQGALRPEVNCGASCSNLQQVAFGSQQSCYIQSGFCTSGLTCMDYAIALMTVGHEQRMFDIMRHTATMGSNCAYAINSNLQSCYNLPEAAKEVVWAAYFGTSYESTSLDDIDPCGTQTPLPPLTPDPTPGPTVYPTPDPTPIEVTPDPTPDPTPTAVTGDYSQYSCENVGQCYSYTSCGLGDTNGDTCVCGTNVDGIPACFRGATPCLGQDCNTDSDCGAFEYCLNANSCCGYPVCVKLDVCANVLDAREIFRKRVVDENGEEWTATYVPRSMRKRVMMG